MWAVSYYGDYWGELQACSNAVQDEIYSLVELLEVQGPGLKRPQCDTLKGSRYANMKELRFSLPDGEWRIAFAFDFERSAILLVGGSKSGTNESRFYRRLIRLADTRFTAHLQTLKKRK